MSNQAVPRLYCPGCGHRIQESTIDNHLQGLCTNSECFYVYWGEFSLGVGGVLWYKNKVLLVQRKHNPGKGMWTIPGGYVDHGEPLADAVVREIQEETGIKAKPLSIIGLRDRPTEKHDTYIIFLMEYLGGTLQAQAEEVSDLGFFTFEECHTLPIPSLTLSVLNASHSDSQGLTLNSDVELIGTLSTLYQIPYL